MDQSFNNLINIFHKFLVELPTPPSVDARVYFPESQAHEHGSTVWELHKAIERSLYVKNTTNAAAIRMFARTTGMAVAIGKNNELEIFTPKGIIIHEHLEYL